MTPFGKHSITKVVISESRVRGVALVCPPNPYNYTLARLGMMVGFV